MQSRTILWVDLRVVSKDKAYLLSRLSLEFNSFYTRSQNTLLSRIEEVAPTILCFHYDSPTSAGLTLLEKAKAAFPSIPILMITKSHSEALAIWALRARVWDYFVEPVPSSHFLDSVNGLFNIRKNNSDRRRNTVTRFKARPSASRRSTNDRVIVKAKQYISTHYSGDISLGKIAEHVGVSSSHFSRLFKKECGENFIDYLWKVRIDAAQAMLLDSDCSISNVCLEVGCNDLSYFSRKFRSLTGMSPSEFKEALVVSEEKTLFDILARRDTSAV